jgi:hypothetical protein
MMKPEYHADKHPEGRTLWEMFQDWRHGYQNGSAPNHGAGSFSQTAHHSPSGYPNPLDWSPGVPAPLNVSHGPEFKDSLTIVESVRHVVRKLGGSSHDFIDYTLRITPRQGNVTSARVRCLPNNTGAWDKMLLRPHDEFAYDQDFENLLADASGIFNIEEDPSGTPAQFTRLNGLEGPWEAAACDHRHTPTAAAARVPFKTLRYWDYSRATEATPDEASGEEFLFIEIDGESGWTQLWRGHFFVL